MSERYDVVVVGGGPAGLAGAVALARSRRSVLVIDDATPRNAPAAHMHNYLGREGLPPGELLAKGRAEVVAYGGQIIAGTVSAVRRLDDPLRDVPDRFAVELGDGRTVRSRRLLVATGLVDELPPVPGVAARWGRDVLHCPFCHGWEARDQAIGILGTGPLAVHGALLWRQLSADVILFRHTAPALTAEQADQLAARGITVIDGEVAALEIRDDQLAGVRMRSGDVVPRQVMVVAPRFVARAGVLAALGLHTEDRVVDDQVIASFVPADANGATAIPGVWVAGNVAAPFATVIAAAAAGMMAGAQINGDLVTEETALAVAARQAA